MKKKNKFGSPLVPIFREGALVPPKNLERNAPIPVDTF